VKITTLIPAVVLVLLSASMPVRATPCRAVAAASVGSQTGYQRDKAASDAWSQREQASSDALSDCLGNLSTTLTMPVFPNLSSILSGIKNKICAAARNKIHQYIPDNIDPWGHINSGQYDDLTSWNAPVDADTPSPETPQPFSLN
jgi:TraL protein